MSTSDENKKHSLLGRLAKTPSNSNNEDNELRFVREALRTEELAISTDSMGIEAFKSEVVTPTKESFLNQLKAIPRKLQINEITAVLKDEYKYKFRDDK